MMPAGSNSWPERPLFGAAGPGTGDRLAFLFDPLGAPASTPQPDPEVEAVGGTPERPPRPQPQPRPRPCPQPQPRTRPTPRRRPAVPPWRPLTRLRKLVRGTVSVLFYGTVYLIASHHDFYRTMTAPRSRP